jgi:hypothetical protein
MADQKKRSDLIREQIENLLKNAPKPYTDAEKEQIAKGRGKRGSAQERQKEIDEGRATVERRNEEVRAFNKQISDLNTQLGDAERDERTAGREDIENASKKRYDEESSSGTGRATQLAANTMTLPAGFVLGRVGGATYNRRADQAQERRNETLKATAADRLAGITTREGAREGARLAGAMPSDNALLRVGGRALPHMIGGAAGIAKGSSMLANSFQGDDFYTDMTNRAMGLGLIGSGVGLIQEGAGYAVTPGVPPDAQSIALINSNQLRRNGPASRGMADRGQIIDAEIIPDAPGQQSLPAPQPGSKAYYAQEAKRLGIKGVTRKTKEQLVQAVNDANAGNATKRVRGPKKLPAVAGPMAAAGLAYMATPGDANASVDGSTTGQDRALTNAAAAGGLTYGTNRLLNALPAGTGAVAGGMMGPLMPITFDPLEGASYEDTAQNISAARGDVNAAMPWVGRNVLGVTPEEQNAYEMAQVPTPSPARVQRGNQGRQDAEYMRRYLADEPVNMPTGAEAGWQDRAASAQPAPDDFDAQLAELQQIMAELEGPAEAPQQARRPMVMPSPSMVSPALQNRLLAVR